MQKHFIGMSAITAVAGALAFSAPAKAADLGHYHGGLKDEPVYVAPTNWGGFYVGGHLGASWTSGSASLKSKCWDYALAKIAVETDNYEEYYCEDSSNHADLGDSSVLGGVHVGYNIQHGAFVYGVEGDVSFADNIDYLASIRGRLGVAANNWLFYATGGVAFIGGGFSGTISDANIASVPYDTYDDQVGFVVGGGVEVKLAPNWSIGVEGLYYGFDGNTYHAAGWDCNNTGCFDYSADANGIADVGVVRARLSYHVGRGYEPLK